MSKKKSKTLRALKYHNYKLFFVSDIVSNTGTWMQRVAQDWVVLTVLSHNNAFAVGIVTACQFAPSLIFAPLAGILADRVDLRNLLRITSFFDMLISAIFGFLLITHTATLYHAYVLAFCLGILGSFEQPAFGAVNNLLVPKKDLSNAIGLGSATFNIARLAGPALAGLLLGIGEPGIVFSINAVSYLIPIITLSVMRKKEFFELPRAKKKKGQFLESLVYIKGRKDLMLIIAVIGIASWIGFNNQVTGSAMVRIVFFKSSQWYGLYSSVLACGTFAGAILIARLEQPRIRLFLFAVFFYGIVNIISAIAPWYWSFTLVGVLVGLFMQITIMSASVYIQVTTPAKIRGRVLSLFFIALLGTTPFGAPIVGWISEVFSPRYSVATGGVVCMLVVVFALLWGAKNFNHKYSINGIMPPQIKLIDNLNKDYYEHSILFIAEDYKKLFKKRVNRLIRKKRAKKNT